MKFSLLRISLIAITLFTSQITFAQDNYDRGFRLGFGLNPGFVVDDPFGFAIGVDGRLQYDISKRYSATLTTGYTHLFAGDKNGVDYKDLGMIPLKAGFKGFWWEDRFYAMGEIGAGFPVTNGYKDITPIIAPSIGWANKYVDLSLKYEIYPNIPVVRNNALRDGTGQLALRLAYGFRL